MKYITSLNSNLSDLLPKLTLHDVVLAHYIVSMLVGVMIVQMEIRSFKSCWLSVR